MARGEHRDGQNGNHENHRSQTNHLPRHNGARHTPPNSSQPRILDSPSHHHNKHGSPGSDRSGARLSRELQLHGSSGRLFEAPTNDRKTMSATKDKKRVRGIRIERQYIVGNEAWHLTDSDRAKDSKIPSNHRFRWRLYVKPIEGGPDLCTWLDKVQFKLHDDYKPNNMRSKFLFLVARLSLMNCSNRESSV